MSRRTGRKIRTPRRSVRPDVESLEHRLVLSGGFDQFPIPGPPPEMWVGEKPAIVSGPDGNLYFAGDLGYVGKVTTDGTVTLIPVPGSGPVEWVAAGTDGQVWFTHGGVIGSIGTDGNVTTIALPSGETAAAITVDDGGNAWYIEHGGFIGRYATDGTFSRFAPPNPGEFFIAQQSITEGSDGNIWFTRLGFQQGFFAMIDRIMPDGTITEFPVSNSYEIALGLTPGPDGNLWFTRSESQVVGSITTDGQITNYAVPGHPRGITTGPDGNLWFTLVTGATGGAIGRITLDGQISTFDLPALTGTPSGQPLAITLGPDGNLWFTQVWGHAIGRLDPAALQGDTGSGPGETAVPVDVTVIYAVGGPVRPATGRARKATLNERIMNAPVSLFFRHQPPVSAVHSGAVEARLRRPRHAAAVPNAHQAARHWLRLQLKAAMARHRRGR